MEESASPPWFAECMARLTSGQDIPENLMRLALGTVIRGAADSVEAAAFLVALRMKGETAAELAAAAGVLREAMVPVPTGRDDVLDTCGTGGDESGSFNISTAAAIVAAAAGAHVVKHGNRAVTGRCGSSDVLAALGVEMLEDPAAVRRSLDDVGLGFCFAPYFHPALRQVADVRRRLRLRTIFNCLGPLANPSSPAYQLLGVGRPEMLDAMAGALALLGIRHAYVVCGESGQDEVSLWGPTLVREIKGHTIRAQTWLPDSFGLAPCTRADLEVADVQESAAVIRAVLEGDEGPAGRAVLANTAAALLAAELTPSLAQGVRQAREAIQTGKARAVLDRLAACSRVKR
jgi:anthranilate phosphoribosyltransferase